MNLGWFLLALWVAILLPLPRVISVQPHLGVSLSSRKDTSHFGLGPYSEGLILDYSLQSVYLKVWSHWTRTPLMALTFCNTAMVNPAHHTPSAPTFHQSLDWSQKLVWCNKTHGLESGSVLSPGQRRLGLLLPY